MKHNWTKVLLSFAVSTTLFSSCKPDPDTDSPPKDVYTPSVFIGSQNQFLYALEPATGRKKWESYIGADIKASPVLHKDIVFVGASNILFELNPNTGTIIKQAKYPFTDPITTTPVAYDSFIHVPSGQNITCFNFILDKEKWTFKAGGTINSSPTIIDTQLIFGCDDGYVYMLDHRNGKQIWKAGPFGTAFFSSPAVDTGRVYIGAEDGKLYALKRKDGSHAWLTGPKQTGAKIRSSPLVYGGTVFFGSDDQKLYAIQIIDGATVWTMNTSDRVRSSPFLQGQTVYVGSYDQNFYAVNVLDGSIKWQFKTGGLIASSPVYYNNRVYFGSYDRNFYALEAEKGALTWKYAINGLIDCSPTVDVNNGQGINSTISGNSTY